ncbi:MAG: hypothetical protein P3B98_12460 [Gemmatimonadota bacterium]|nr:hypothetical protein [Gemmatimonadota bacterium]
MSSSSPPRLSKGARVVLGLGLTVVSCVFALLAVEVGVRIARVGSDQFLRPDPVLGVRFIESKSGLSQSTCYSADVTIGAAGWRSPDVATPKPDDVYRILVLGDSFMAGLQVNDGETLARLLERRLGGAARGRRVEVVNFGVPSFGTDQQLIALREYGLALQPDLVVLAFYAQNDVAENDRMLRSNTNTDPKPYFELQAGQLVELPFRDNTPAAVQLVRRAVAPLRIYPLTRDALVAIPLTHRVLYGLGIVNVVPQQNRNPAPTSTDGTIWNWPDRWRRQIGVFELEPWADWGHAWSVTEALVAAVHREAVRGQAEFVIAGVASPIEVMPTQLLGQLIDKEEQIDVSGPGNRLEAIAHRQGVQLVSTVPGFRQRVAQRADVFERLFLSCDGHWTAAGHELAADLLEPVIRERVQRGPTHRVARLH